MYALKNLTKLVLTVSGWHVETPEPRQHQGGTIPVMTFSPRF